MNATQSQVLDLLKAADTKAIIHIKRSSADPVNVIARHISGFSTKVKFITANQVTNKPCRSNHFDGLLFRRFVWVIDWQRFILVERPYLC